MDPHQTFIDGILDHFALNFGLNNSKPQSIKEHILITGMSGIGKTYCCNKIMEFFPLNTTLLTEWTLIDHLDQSILYQTFISLSPSCSIFIIDHPLAPPSILSIMKYIINSCSLRGIMVIFVQNYCHQLDEYSLCRSGLLSLEIRITFSTKEERENLLKKLSYKGGDLVKDAALMIGYTPVDIISFINNGSILKGSGGSGGVSPSSLKGLERFIMKDSSTMSYLSKEMVGVKSLKEEMISLIKSCCLEKSSYDVKKSPRGMIVHGGSGKSRIVGEVCKAVSITTIGVCSCDIVSKYLGESEKNLSLLFERARVCSPAILVIDDLDVLIGNRRSEGGGEYSSSERLMTTMLIELDGLLSRRNGDGVFVIGIIGCKLENLDGALIREGRLSNHFEMPSLLENEELGEELLLRLLEDMNINNLNEDEIEILTKMIKGMEAPEIEGMLKEMIMKTLRQDPDAQKMLLI